MLTGTITYDPINISLMTSLPHSSEKEPIGLINSFGAFGVTLFLCFVASL